MKYGGGELVHNIPGEYRHEFRAGHNCLASAFGGADLTKVFNGQIVTVNNARGIIDLVAPLHVLHYPMFYSYYWLGETLTYKYISYSFDEPMGGGTSTAAPLAASAAVSLKDWSNYVQLGLLSQPGAMHVNMLLMGNDAGNGRGEYPELNSRADVSGISNEGMDIWWGAGKVSMRHFTNDWMCEPWGYSTSAFYVYDGAIIDIPITEGANLPIDPKVGVWKGVVAWDEPYLYAQSSTGVAASINVSLVTAYPTSNGKCSNPEGGQSVAVIAADRFHDVQKRLLVISSQDVESLWHKCAYMRVEGINVPPGPNGEDRRFVYTANYFENAERKKTYLQGNWAKCSCAPNIFKSYHDPDFCLEGIN